MAKDSTPIEGTDEESFELDLTELDNDELAQFETNLVEEYAEMRSSETLSADDADELTALAAAIAEVRAEMESRVALFEADEFVADAKASDFTSRMAKKVAAPAAATFEEEVAEVVVPEIVISPKGLEGDIPASDVTVVAAARKPLAKIAADVRGFRSGQEVDSWTKVASAFIARHPDIRSSDVSSGSRFLVASIEAEFPEDRILGDDAVVNTRKIESITSDTAITASGGLCAPLTPWYNLQTYGDVCRPIRDSLPSFKADRGGIRYVTPPRLSDLAGSSRVTTAAQDALGYTTQTPAGPTPPKPCLHVVCGAENTCVIQAVSSCLTFGNFGSRTYPEQVEAWLKLGRVEFARYQEQELLRAINAGSTQITAAQVYGATFSILEQIGFTVASFRDRFRICNSVNLRLIAPFWLANVLKDDLAAQAPGDGLGRYNVSDAMLNDWLRQRGVTVTWAQDTLASDPQLPAPVAGPIGSYPNSVRWFIFPEGEWLFLDNGVLDLGLVRDSQLNSVNDYQVWFEEFSGICQVGRVESLAIVSDLCANGTYANGSAVRVCPLP